jgi:hypothetical protein
MLLGRGGKLLRACSPWLARPCALLLKALAILLPVSGLALGLAYVRLLQGPLSVGFLVAPVERGINGDLPGLHTQIEDAIVRLSDQGGIEFRLTNVRVSESDGDLVASAPFAGVQLSSSALLSGRIAPARLELIEPQLLVSRDEQGRLSLSFGPPDLPAARGPSGSSGAGTAQSAQVAVEPLSRRLDLARTFAEAAARARRQEDASSFLQSIGLKNASVVLETSGKRVSWLVPEFDVSLVHRQSSELRHRKNQRRFASRRMSAISFRPPLRAASLTLQPSTG